jgi:hypothetical protein
MCGGLWTGLRNMRNKFLVMFNLVILEGWGRDKVLRRKEGDASILQLVLGFRGLSKKFW